MCLLQHCDKRRVVHTMQAPPASARNLFCSLLCFGVSAKLCTDVIGTWAGTMLPTGRVHVGFMARSEEADALCCAHANALRCWSSCNASSIQTKRDVILTGPRHGVFWECLEFPI
eukprot:CAMPEP_0172786472 /NCGR_PEP_ID=MMETSP1074-20121228/205966_1 /TAXON_ID=2916 /ORGANISM="Ceratium fusus, Strain PA161109" /LENGTH=114 /DNA_ID=CAMNT_0013623487 /DNA_START=1005 /DNA_END=1349 /DNA_ORIENTATION=-